MVDLYRSLLFCLVILLYIVSVLTTEEAKERNGTTILPLTTEITHPSNTVGTGATAKESSGCHCSVRMTANSIDDLAYYARTRKIKLAHIHVSFQDTVKVLKPTYVFKPLNWIWTYHHDAGAKHFLSFPVDYRVLSLGILDAGSQFNMNVSFDVTPADSVMNLDSGSTTQKILNELGRVFMTHLSVIDGREEYNHTIWCRREIRKTMNMADYVLNVLGIPNHLVELICCNLRFDKIARVRRVVCSNNYVEHDYLTTRFPFVIGVLALLYLPIALCSYAYSMTSRTVIAATDERGRHGKASTDLSDSISWFYQEAGSPVTVSSVFTRSFLGLKENTLFTSRLQRVIFMLLCWTVVVLQISLYHYFDAEYLRLCMERNLSIGYTSILFGFEESRLNVYTMLGGPGTLIGVYIVVGSTLLCLPSSLSQSMCSTLHRGPLKTWTPLRLNVHTISRLSGMNFLVRDHNFNLVAKVLRGNVYMLLNTDFWKEACRVQIARLQNIMKRLDNLSEVERWIILVPLAVAYTLLCVMEWTLCIFYYGLPVVYFFILLLRMYVSLTVKTFKGICCSHNKCLQRLIPTLAAVIIVGIITYILFTFCTIVLTSVTFLATILTYTYIAIFAVPDSEIGYVTFVFISVYHILTTVREIDKGYLQLLRKTIAVSKERLASKEGVKENGPDAVDRAQCGAVDGVPFVRMCNGHTCIPVDLYEYAVEKHLPFRVSLLSSAVQLCSVCLLIGVTLHLMEEFSQFQEMSSIVKLLSTILVSAVPGFLGMSATTTEDDDADSDDDFHTQLTRTVRQYWGKKQHREATFRCNRGPDDVDVEEDLDSLI